MDRRWQLALDCLDCEQAPFGKGTLVRFRAALIACEGDRRLVERTVVLVEKKGGFNSRSLKAALDSSPLWGAARVEDTYNLLGHALRKALTMIARQQQLELEEIASQSGASLIAGSSLKAVLDLDWDEPEVRTQALKTILQTLTACSVNKCNAFVINWGYTQFRPDSLMSRYSLDFRRKVVTAYELGFGSIRQLADQFMISPATVHSYIKISRETQDITPKKPGPNRPVKREHHRDFIVQMVKNYPDWTVRQYREHLLGEVFV